MKSAKFLGTLVVIAAIVIGAYYVNQYQQQTQQQTALSSLFLSSLKDKATLFFNTTKVYDCEAIMNQQNLAYALCTMLSDGTVVLHDSSLNCSAQLNPIPSCGAIHYSNTFHPGDYFGLQVNLQKLNEFYPTYYACVGSDLPVVETSYPLVNGKTTTGGTVYQNQFFCSPALNETKYYHLVFSGFILNQPGNYNFEKIWIFDASLGQMDFANNLDKGKLVFTLSGDVV